MLTYFSILLAILLIISILVAIFHDSDSVSAAAAFSVALILFIVIYPDLTATEEVINEELLQTEILLSLKNQYSDDEVRESVVNSLNTHYGNDLRNLEININTSESKSLVTKAFQVTYGDYKAYALNNGKVTQTVSAIIDKNNPNDVVVFCSTPSHTHEPLDRISEPITQ